LKAYESQATISGADLAQEGEEDGDTDAMNEETFGGIELNRADSLMMRRFDPEMMMPISLSRSVSMSQNAQLETSLEKLRDIDLEAFMKEQQQWNQAPANSNLEHGGSMMMEELPTDNFNRKFSDEYLHDAPVLKNQYSFLDYEREPFQSSANLFISKLAQGNQLDTQGAPKNVQTKMAQQEPIIKIRQAQDEIFSHDGERGGRVPIDVIEGKPVCNCHKSQCLKLYCMCFRKGYSCTDKCRCVQCQNTPKNHELIMTRRNQKIIRQMESEEKFCNCRMSFCEKSYCVCARNGLGCSKLCKCFNCKNPNGTKKHHH
jgi:hypothetical protein